MVYIGADVCRAGWLAVILREEKWKVALFPDIFGLWEQHRDASLILLDIPIGLRNGGGSERSCDKEARKLLGVRRASIFPVPCRPAIYADTYEQASKINEQKTGRKLPRQVWNIIPRIKEVDQLLATDMVARSRIRETHPEVCFWALNGGQPMAHYKKKREGFLERKQLLYRVYPVTQEVVAAALRQYPRSKVAKDDILDTLVAAVTASAGASRLSAIPVTVELDAHQLPMEIVYYRT